MTWQTVLGSFLGMLLLATVAVVTWLLLQRWDRACKLQLERAERCEVWGFALHPGTVLSRTDGDHHRISGAQLADCYRVPIGACKEWRLGMAPDHYIHLYPDESGHYNLPPGSFEFIVLWEAKKRREAVRP